MLLPLLLILCVMSGCKKTENVGNLKILAQNHINSLISRDKSQGADCTITDTLVCNDSVIVIQAMDILSDGGIIPEEFTFVRKRTSKGFSYYTSCRLFLNKRSIAEDIKIGNTPCNSSLLKTLLKDEKNGTLANNLLYVKALSECIKSGAPMKDIKN